MNGKDRFLKEYPASLSDDNGVIFVGAGVSAAAGYPSWSTLLKEVGEELGVPSTDVHDLAALAQWSIHTNGRNRVGQLIRDSIGVDKPIPSALKILSRLPVRHIWTTNYDLLIERAFSEVNRPLDVISGELDLSLKPRPGAVRLYKMHGSVNRLDDIVISTDDYELFRRKRGAYLPLLQAHLTSMSMLFVGLSFTDPNVKHVLALIRESFTDNAPEHFAIVKAPQRSDFKKAAEFSAKRKQHDLWAKDLQRYGLVAVEINAYTEIPELLQKVERRVSRKRVWLSGSWPTEQWDSNAEKSYRVAESLGKHLGAADFSLVTGGGLLVSSGSISGFLDSLRHGGGWDLDRRLISRPFPQPASGKSPDGAKWTLLREQLARLAGTVIFIGGAKVHKGAIVEAAGVIEEFELAKQLGCFLLPIGATSGAAKTIATSLIGSAVPSKGPLKARPTDADLRFLLNENLSIEDLADRAFAIVKQATKN